jgi:uncharacterized PurR-regulated membrane protein YhhQ (DUF165 family)
MKGRLALIGYIGTIFAANWALQRYGFVPVGFGLVAPAGVFFAGLAFILRDIVQDDLGKGWTIAAILVGAACSWFVSPQFAVASGAAFLLSETADFLVYTPLRERAWLLAALLSNTVGDVVDSLLFLWLAFGSLANIAGLLVGKWEMNVLVFAYLAWRRVRVARVAVA